MTTVQHTFFSFPLPLHNAVAALLTLAYVFSVPPLMEWFVSNRGLSREVSRKITHICAGSVIVFLPLFREGDWSYLLNISVFAIWAVLLVQKGLFAADDDQAVMTMTRTGDKRELLRGTLMFVIVAMVCGSIYYKQLPGVLAMAVLGWGDGLAPIVGVKYGRMKYHVTSPKSIEGSLAFFVGALAAGLFFVRLIVPEAFDPAKIALIAAVATVVEGLSPREVDNVLIPVTVITLSTVL